MTKVINLLKLLEYLSTYCIENKRLRTVEDIDVAVSHFFEDIKQSSR